MRNLSLLLLALLVAGCLSTTETTPAPPTPEAEVLPQLAQVRIGIGGDAESGVAVSGDGQVVLACSHGGFTQPSPLWASEDAGSTFRRIDPQPNPIVSGDCDLAITENGDWFIIYDTIASATVAGSSDQGRTWRFHYFSAPPFGGVDRPWLQAVGNQLYLTYADVMSAEPFNAMFTKSTDGGRTWAPPTKMATFADTPGQTNCFLGHLVVRDAGRTIHNPIDCYAPTQTSQRTTYFVSSRDGGASWTVRPLRGPDTTSIRIPTATYAGEENMWLAYTTGTPNRSVFAILSRDDGRTWTEPLLVARDTRMAIGWPWIDGRPDGSATIAWMNTSRPANVSGNQPYWQVHAARVDADPDPRLVFESPVGEPAQGSAIFEFLMVRHDGEGRAHIVYVVPGEGCQQSPPVTASPSRNRQCVHLLRES